MGVCFNKGRKVKSNSLDSQGRFRSEWRNGEEMLEGDIAVDNMMRANGHVHPMPNDPADAANFDYEEPQIPVMFVLGGPGSGKITHCDHCVHDRPGVAHINMTDLMQQHVVGNELKDFAQIPARKVVQVLAMEMKMAAGSAIKGFLVSGYPRNMRDVVEYSEKLQRVDGVILIDWHERILEKQIEYGANLGAVVIDLARMELTNYKKNVRPVAEFFDHRGQLKVINGERHPEEVYEDFLTYVDETVSEGATRAPKPITNKMIMAPVVVEKHTNVAPAFGNKGKMDGSSGPPVLWVMGGPGSNKGVLCRKVAALHPGWHHVSVGGLLRRMASQADRLANRPNFQLEQAERIRTFIQQGEFVPQDLVLKLVSAQMSAARASTKIEGFIVDGFPRDFNQMQTFEKMFQQEPPLILIDCSELELGRNLGGRLTSEKRDDDQRPAAVRRRLQLYRETTLPMLKALDEKSRLIIVDGDVESAQVLLEFKRAVGTVVSLLRTSSRGGNPFASNGALPNTKKGNVDYGPRVPLLNQANAGGGGAAAGSGKRASVDTITAMYNEVAEGETAA